MNLEVIVRAQGQHWSGGAAMVVPDPLQWAFEPLKTTDDAFMAFLNGEQIADNVECKKKLMVREGAAEYMAKAITELLLREMKKHDTHNGYLISSKP